MPTYFRDRTLAHTRIVDRQRRAYAYALTAVALWSTVASAFKLALRYQDPLDLLFFSSWTSVCVLLAVLVIGKKLDRLLAYGATDYLKSALYGLLNPFAYYVVLFKAYDLLPAQEAQPLNYTWAVVLTILSIVVLRQPMGLVSIAGVTVSLGGAAVIATRGDLAGLHFSDPLGVSLAVGSSLIWACFWLCNMRDAREEAPKLFLNFVFGSAYTTVAVLCVGGPRVPEAGGLAAAAYVGAFEMGVTFVFWLKALKLSTTTARVGNLIYLSPFVSLVLIHVVVGEAIRPSSVLGLGLIIGGVVIQRSDPRARAAQSARPASSS
jgi:drug/metabolite transporter (DMT)-like permease